MSNVKSDKGIEKRKEFQLSYSGNILKHLGISMYSSIPHALAELISNSYDADAEQVNVTISNESPKEIVIWDNGEGMSDDDIRNRFLVVGNNRRHEEARTISTKGRKVTGKKGLGKFALFGLTDEVEISTGKKGSEELNTFSLNWKEMTREGRGGDYIIQAKVTNKDKEKHFTKITLKNIEVEKIDIEKQTKELSFLLNFFSNDFSVKMEDENSKVEIDNRTRYDTIEQEDIQFKWLIPEDFKIELPGEYKDKNIKGRIFASRVPFKQKYRGIALFANRRMVNAPGFFSKKDSSHFFSYISGWLEIDFLDENNDDLIATNRTSLVWSHRFIKEINLKGILHKFLDALQKDWRKKRKDLKDKKVKEVYGIDRDIWISNVPGELRGHLEGALKLFESIDVDDDDKGSEAMSIIYKHLLPPYAEFMLWAQFHEKIKEDRNIEKAYKNGMFFYAFNEAYKKYIKEIRELSDTIKGTDAKLLDDSIAYKKWYYTDDGNMKPKKNNPVIKIVEDEVANIEDSIQTSFLRYSQAIQNFRNVSNHILVTDIEEKYYTKEECLHALKVISYLFFQLDRRASPPKEEGK